MLYFLYHIRARLVLEQWLIFKVIFAWKYIKIIIFFIFKKFIIDISTSKQYENTKNN